jgi:hypothetical protein
MQDNKGFFILGTYPLIGSVVLQAAGAHQIFGTPKIT